MPRQSGRSEQRDKIRFSTRAVEDLEAIAEYTVDRFGVSQERKYRAALFEAFNLLATFPKTGASQEPIAPGLRRHIHASHAIYYSIHDDRLLIERILGPGQDPVLEFLGKR